jgi:hypothetical protein
MSNMTPYMNLEMQLLPHLILVSGIKQSPNFGEVPYFYKS